MRGVNAQTNPVGGLTITLRKQFARQRRSRRLSGFSQRHGAAGVFEPGPLGDQISGLRKRSAQQKHECADESP